MPMKPHLLALAALAAAVSLPPAVHAHPHTYIDMEVGIEVSADGVEGLSFRWTLLRNFGTEVLARYDADGDGHFDAGETALVQCDAFANIGTYHHFIHVAVEGTEYRVGSIEGFSVAQGGGQVSYSFRVPCRICVGDAARTVELSVYDETSYVSFALRYVDDGQDESLATGLEIVRNHEVYSHGNDLGNPTIVFTMSPTGPERTRRVIIEGLVASSSLPPVPGGTYSNPFVSTGLSLDASSNPNPFFGGP
jgi:ABC-type uncharacterized transport system substrate-binding protein